MTGLHLRAHQGRGAGPPVILVHGSMDRSAAFARVMAELVELDVCRYDRRGYGASALEGEGLGLDGHVADLLAVAAGRRCVVVGHSFGGVIALAAATRRPDVVTGVAAFEAPMQWQPWWPEDSAGSTAVRHAEDGADGPAAAEAFLRQVLGHERYLALAGREQRLAEGTALVAELLSIRRGPVPYDLRALPVPVLAGTGTDSLAHMQRAAAVLAEEAPLGELYVLEGAGHGAHVSHPAAFAAYARRAVALATGYIREYPLERYLRDARVHQILEGTNEIMRVIVGRDLLR